METGLCKALQIQFGKRERILIQQFKDITKVSEYKEQHQYFFFAQQYQYYTVFVGNHNNSTAQKHKKWKEKPFREF